MRKEGGKMLSVKLVKGAQNEEMGAQNEELKKLNWEKGGAQIPCVVSSDWWIDEKLGDN